MPARTSHKQYKGRANFYRSGSNNIICDRTGFKMKAEDCKQEWNGFFVRRESWERRQPQDLLRGFPDRQQPDISRPGTGVVFIESGGSIWDDGNSIWDNGNSMWD
jgi:hypothetical protein